MFAMTMGPQDISFDNMRRHQRAITEVVRRASGCGYGRFVHHGRQPGGHFRTYETSRSACSIP